MGLNLEPNMDANTTPTALIALLRQTNRDLLAALVETCSELQLLGQDDPVVQRVLGSARAAITKAKELNHG